MLEQGLVQRYGAQFHVRPSHGEYPHVVTLGADETTEGAGTRCTCAFWLKHQGTRGPCKHVLAAQLLTRA